MSKTFDPKTQKFCIFVDGEPELRIVEGSRAALEFITKDFGGELRTSDKKVAGMLLDGNMEAFAKGTLPYCKLMRADSRKEARIYLGL